MKILITNDDGVNAPGIRLLTEWAKKLGDVTVVAPKVEQSAKSHAIEIVKKIEIKKVPFMDGVTAYSVDSTPADCVRFGVLGLGEKYDLVLSGVNKGVNVGADIVYSGTIAATFEAARLGVKAIALSAFYDDQENAVKHLDTVYQYIMDNKLFDENPVYNVNIPYQVKGIRITEQGSFYFSDRFIKLDEEDMYIQDGEPIPDDFPDDINRDTVAIVSGYISVTPLNTSRTNMQVFEKWKNK
jgi:5'-nucleotidase